MIRSATDLSRAAYVGGICQCVPCFTKSTNTDGTVSEGFLDHLANLYGHNLFSAGSESTRFQSLLEGDSVLGKDLRKHFIHMQREVHGECEYHELPDDSPFKLGPQGAGIIKGRLVSRPQHAFTQAVENARSDAIMHELKLKLTEGSMPCREEAAFLSVNRLSVQFVGLPKMRLTIMDNIIFHEAWSVYMHGNAQSRMQRVGWH